nr:unnamed protein product [Callosobruchus analis]
MIVSDSLSALEAIEQIYPRHPILVDIKEKLENIHRTRKNIKFLWVPSHTGIRGNEEADSAAVTLTTESHSATHYTTIPQTDHKITIRQYTNTKWNVYSSKLRDIVSELPAKVPHLKTRRDQVVISRLRVGYTLLTHQHLFNRCQPPVCETCEVPITVKHFLVECPVYNRQRICNNIPIRVVEKQIPIKIKSTENSREIQTLKATVDSPMPVIAVNT